MEDGPALSCLEPAIVRVPLRANPEYLWRRLAILSVAVVALALLLAAGADT